MKTFFWILLLLNLALIGFLVYHFATYEHVKVAPSPALAGSYSDSVKVYRDRLAELEQSAAVLRNELDRTGKSGWPAVHARLAAADDQIAELRAAIDRLDASPDGAGSSEVNHEIYGLYGKAAVLYMSLSFDTMGVARPKEDH